jgi:putative endonuclease
MPMGKNYYVYILTNKQHGTLYIGITSDLARRVYEHKQGLAEGFTKKYGLKRLVYIEVFDDVRLVIQREKSLKRWSRQWKIELIEKANPDWDDLFESLQV